MSLNKYFTISGLFISYVVSYSTARSLCPLGQMLLDVPFCKKKTRKKMDYTSLCHCRWHACKLLTSILSPYSHLLTRSTKFSGEDSATAESGSPGLLNIYVIRIHQKVDLTQCGTAAGKFCFTGWPQKCFAMKITWDKRQERKEKWFYC